MARCCRRICFVWDLHLILYAAEELFLDGNKENRGQFSVQLAEGRAVLCSLFDQYGKLPVPLTGVPLVLMAIPLWIS